MKNLDKYRGCIVGGAAGDALGYACEFFDAATIFYMYGDNGITEYDLHNGVARFSDDTQMTLFTANALLFARTRSVNKGIMAPYPSYIGEFYKEWLRTQEGDEAILEKAHFSWILNVPEICNRRGPGTTCLTAIRRGANGTIDNPINNSKGCGGLMRVAPIGLYFADKLSQDEIDILGAETAALTHGHELGYIPAAAIVHIISLVVSDENITLLEAVEDAIREIPKLFPKAKHIEYFISLMEKAIELSNCDLDDLDAIRMLGAGWVAEQNLAISVYCALKYSNDFEKAIIAAVNHDGDTDSTGAVTGNIIGAYLGMNKIPEKFLNKLEIKDVILELADDLYKDCNYTGDEYEDYLWDYKYIYAAYDGKNKPDKIFVNGKENES